MKRSIEQSPDFWVKEPIPNRQSQRVTAAAIRIRFATETVSILRLAPRTAHAHWLA